MAYVSLSFADRVQVPSESVRERKCERATPPVVGERKFERKFERERERERERAAAAIQRRPLSSI